MFLEALQVAAVCVGEVLAEPGQEDNSWLLFLIPWAGSQSTWESPFSWFIFFWGTGFMFHLMLYIVFVPLGVLRWFRSWGEP